MIIKLPSHIYLKKYLYVNYGGEKVELKPFDPISKCIRSVFTNNPMNRIAALETFIEVEISNKMVKEKRIFPNGRKIATMNYQIDRIMHAEFHLFMDDYLKKNEGMEIKTAICDYASRYDWAVDEDIRMDTLVKSYYRHKNIFTNFPQDNIVLHNVLS